MWPSSARGAGASKFGLPSVVRGISLRTKEGHCAAAGEAMSASAMKDTENDRFIGRILCRLAQGGTDEIRGCIRNDPAGVPRRAVGAENPRARAGAGV